MDTVTNKDNLTERLKEVELACAKTGMTLEEAGFYKTQHTRGVLLWLWHIAFGGVFLFLGWITGSGMSAANVDRAYKWIDSKLAEREVIEHQSEVEKALKEAGK